MNALIQQNFSKGEETVNTEELDNIPLMFICASPIKELKKAYYNALSSYPYLNLIIFYRRTRIGSKTTLQKKQPLEQISLMNRHCFLHTLKPSALSGETISQYLKQRGTSYQKTLGQYSVPTVFYIYFFINTNLYLIFTT